MYFHYALEPSQCTFSERVVEGVGRVRVQEPDVVQVVVVRHVAVGGHGAVGKSPLPRSKGGTARAWNFWDPGSLKPGPGQNGAPHRIWSGSLWRFRTDARAYIHKYIHTYIRFYIYRYR